MVEQLPCFGVFHPGMPDCDAVLLGSKLCCGLVKMECGGKVAWSCDLHRKLGIIVEDHPQACAMHIQILAYFIFHIEIY